MKLAPVVRLESKRRPARRAGWKRLLFFWKRDGDGTTTSTAATSAPAATRASVRPKTSVLSPRPAPLPGHAGPSGDLRPHAQPAPPTAPTPSMPPRANPFLPSIALSTRKSPGERSRFSAPNRPAARAPAEPPAVRNAERAASSIPPVAAPARDSTSATVPIRAVALAHETANAVGTVELSCSAAGLRVRFVRISAWSEGYVPYPATVSQNLVVPYDQVARVTIDGDNLVHLVLDPSLTPYSRLVLAGLIHDVSFDHRTSHRRRSRIERDLSLGACLAWIPVAMALSALIPSLSTVLVIAIGLTLSGILHTMRRDIASRLVLFSGKSEMVRDELLAELSMRLPPGRVREQVAAAMPAPAAAPAELGEPDAPEPGSLKGLFVTAGVVAAAAAIAILVGKSLIADAPDQNAFNANDDPWAAVSGTALPAAQLPASASAGPIQPDPTRPKPVLPACVCERADSPLWNDGLPRLSVIPRNRPGVTSPERPSMYPEIAVVNNTADDIKDIVLTVDFLLGGQDGRKPRVLDSKDLFWEGKLGPGKAVKWRVKGRGDDYRIKSFVAGLLGEPGSKPAPADAFYELSTSARTPSVRVHGTKMLAYLGDARAAEVLDKLRRDANGEFGDTLDQIAEATRPMRVCAVRANPAQDGSAALRVEACVFNAGKEAKEAPLVTARSRRTDSVRESRWTVDATVAPGAGVLTSGTVEVPEGDQEPLQVELVVEP